MLRWSRNESLLLISWMYLLVVEKAFNLAKCFRECPGSHGRSLWSGFVPGGWGRCRCTTILILLSTPLSYIKPVLAVAGKYHKRHRGVSNTTARKFIYAVQKPLSIDHVYIWWCMLDGRWCGDCCKDAKRVAPTERERERERVLLKPARLRRLAPSKPHGLRGRGRSFLRTDSRRRKWYQITKAAVRPITTKAPLLSDE